jgi:hypothetical protein
MILSPAAFRKAELVFFHPDFSASELDAFGFQANALLGSGFAGEQDFSAGSEDSMPGEAAFGFAEGPGDSAGVAGESGGCGDGSVGGDFASGNFRDDFAHFFEHGDSIAVVR